MQMSVAGPARLLRGDLRRVPARGRATSAGTVAARRQPEIAPVDEHQAVRVRLDQHVLGAGPRRARRPARWARPSATSSRRHIQATSRASSPSGYARRTSRGREAGAAASTLIRRSAPVAASRCRKLVDQPGHVRQVARVAALGDGAQGVRLAGHQVVVGRAARQLEQPVVADVVEVGQVTASRPARRAGSRRRAVITAVAGHRVGDARTNASSRLSARTVGSVGSAVGVQGRDQLAVARAAGWSAPNRSASVRAAVDQANGARRSSSHRPPRGRGAAAPGAAAGRRRPGRAGRAGRRGRRRARWSAPVLSTKPGHRQHLAVEVAGVQRLAPDRLVDGAQLGDRELGADEGGGQRGVLQLGPGPFQPVGEDPAVVEGELPAGQRGRPAARPPRRRRVPAPGSGRSGAKARWATETTRIRGSRSGAP